MRRVPKLAMLRKTLGVVENWQEVVLVYFGLRRGVSTLRMRDGLRIRLRAGSTDIHAFATVWLLEEYSRPGFAPGDGGTIIDIGAHIGLYTAYISRISRDSEILSFEPASANYALLKENVELNSLGRVSTFNLAVAGRSGGRSIFLSEDHAAHSIYKESGTGEAVDCVTLDKIIGDNGVERVSMLKLDCEGAEYDILKGASDDSFEKIEKICMEYHTGTGDSGMLDELRGDLARRGFRLEVVHISDETGMIFASR